MSLRLFHICRAGGRKASSIAFNSMKLRHVSTSDLHKEKDHKRKESSEDTFDFNKIRNEIRDNWLKSEAASPDGARTKARYCCFTLQDAHREYLKPSANWHWLDRELSSNVAGETGAVHIYKGALAAMKVRPLSFSCSSDAADFAMEHVANESAHLRMFQAVVPHGKHTRLLPMWRAAGWVLGFFPTLLGGSKALYVTVESVETFVEEHFQEQIVPLKKQDNCPELLRLLEHCCEDEVHHKEDAERRLLNYQDISKGDSNYQKFDAWWVTPWSKIVRTSSTVAAEIARRI